MNKITALAEAVDKNLGIKVKVDGTWNPWFGQAEAIQNDNLVILNHDCVDIIPIDVIEDWIIT